MQKQKLKKVGQIFLSIYYILKILLFSPPFLFYIFLRNFIMKRRAIFKLKRTLIAFDVPRNIRKDMVKQYKYITGSFKLRNLLDFKLNKSI